MRNSPAIAAAVELTPARDLHRGAHQLYRDTITALLAETRLPVERIDGILAPPMGQGSSTPDMYFYEKLVDELGVRPRIAFTVNAGGATYGAMVQQAALAISAGMAEAILCVGAGMFGVVGPDAAAELARFTCHEDLEYLYGPIIPALYAQYATRYMHDNGIRSEDLAAVSVSARSWALRNPHALTHSKGAISIDDVLASRMIASPLHLLDCSIPCHGGGAVLVTSGALARELTDQPAYILGMGQAHGNGYVSQSPGVRPAGISESGRGAFDMSGLTPREIQHAQVYDAFSFCPLIILEGLGFAAPQEVADWFQSGRTSPGGDFPVNTYGGLIGYGHTGESSGMSMLVEGARQVMGLEPDRQVAADTALVHVYGGMMASHCTLILGREAA